jgi:hypothetical protein
MLAVSVAAMAHAKYQDGVSSILKTETVIAGSEAEFRRINVLEAFDIPLCCGEVAGSCVQNPECVQLIDGTEV